MFLRYLDFLFKPFRQARNLATQGKNIKGNLKVDVDRVKRYGRDAKDAVKGAKAKATGAGGQIQGVASGGAKVAGAAGSGYPGQAAMVAPHGSPPPILKTGSLWWKKHVCGQCQRELDKSWDRCPYCAQGQAAPAPMGSPKTQAIALDAAGQGVGHQMLAWLVPLRGPQRGELFTLAPLSSIGTDVGCTVVLMDQYMSSRHAEIKAEGGQWILHDLRSTNGTYVNDKRIERHELIDSDFVRFGQVLVKFKCM
jgi:hypothetical protein